jgi:predicted aspartyl protease
VPSGTPLRDEEGITGNPQILGSSEVIAGLFKEASPISVPMRLHGGTYAVPVLINDAVTLDFVVDSGAADVSIPEDVVLKLVRTGILKDSDFWGEQTYVLADGSRVPSRTFRIRSLKVGDRVLGNVSGSVSPVQSSLVLGQSFLSRFKSWSVDNTGHSLF